MRPRLSLLLALAVALVWTLGVTTPALAGTGTVSGSATIVGDGAPPANGQVWFYAVGGGSPSSTPLTDGSFSATDLADGDYRVRLELSTMNSYSPWYVAGQPAGSTLSEDATVVHISGGPVSLDAMVVPQIATVSGSVTDGDGNPLGGIAVTRNQYGSKTTVQSDGEGRFDFGFSRPGTTWFSVEGTGSLAGDFRTMSVPATGHLDVDLTMPVPAGISGVVAEQGSGNPIPYLEVSAIGVGDHGGGTWETTYTDVDGRYAFSGMHSGEYLLRYQDYDLGVPTAFNDGASAQESAPHLVTVAGEVLTHDEVLVPRPAPTTTGTFTLSGTVREDVAPLDGVGRGLAGIEVIAEPEPPSWPLETWTDRSGRWAIDAPPGTYTIHVASSSWLDEREGHGVPWFPEFYPDAWDVASGAQVTLPPGGQIDDLDMDLTRAMRLTTTISASGGRTDLVSSARVYAPGGAVVSDRLPVSGGGGGGGTAVVLLRPGSWKVLVRGVLPGTHVGWFVPQWYGGGRTLGEAPVVSGAGGTDISGSPVVLPRRLAPVVAPRVSGRVAVGERLRVSNGLWNQMTDTTFAVTWQRGFTDVGHHAGYRVRRADVGHTLRARVRATNGRLGTTYVVKLRVRR